MKQCVRMLGLDTVKVIHELFAKFSAIDWSQLPVFSGGEVWSASISAAD